MRHASFVAGMLIAIAVLAAALPAAVYGQGGAAATDWAKLSPAEFCTQAAAALAQTGLTDQTAAEIQRQAAARLLIAATFDEASYKNLLQLYLWGKSELSAEQQSTILSRLAPPTDEVASWNYWKMMTSFEQMRKVGLPSETCGSLVVTWLQAQQEIDGESLSNPDRLGYFERALNSLGPRATEFSISWTGAVKAPYDGAYVFSICPVDVRSDGPPGPQIKVKMTVSVDGQQVLNAGQGDWISDGTPVALKAGQLTPLQVDFSYSTSTESIYEPFPAVARLSWQGPGVTKQLVPASALWSPDGTQPGLTAKYSWEVYNAQSMTITTETATTTEPVIDHVWTWGSPVVTKYGQQRAWLAGRLAALAMAPEYLAELEAKPETPHFLLRMNDPTKNVLGWWLLTMLGSDQRTAFAEELLARPVLLTPAARETICRLYLSCWISAPDTALRLFGKWAQMHPESEPQFGVNMHMANRREYRTLGYSVAWQYPPHSETLERDYLVQPDGGCCLPVAYVLSYSHGMKGRIEQWVEKLDERLKDTSLSGDRRVGWLLARAEAEEIRFSGATGHHGPTYQYLAGKGWLDEACLTAQSEPVRLRAYKELAVRLAMREQFAEARKMLDQAARRASSADSTASLATWRGELDQMEASRTASHTAKEQAAQQAYWKELRARRQQAIDVGDDAAASHYEQILTSAGQTP